MEYVDKKKAGLVDKVFVTGYLSERAIDQIFREVNQQKIGKEFKVLMDRKEGEYFVGRTEFDSTDVDNEVLIKIENDLYLRPADFVQVVIIDAMDFDLYGKVV